MENMLDKMLEEKNLAALEGGAGKRKGRKSASKGKKAAKKASAPKKAAPKKSKSRSK